MPFPLSELNLGGTFAFIVTLDNQLRVYKVAPVYGRIFHVPDLGDFHLDEEYRYILTNGRAEIYFYSQKGTNPNSLQAYNELDDYAKKKEQKCLEMRDICLFVDKFRKVEVGKAVIERLQNDPNNPITDEQLADILNDANFDFTVEKLTALSKPRPGGEGLPSENAIAWLNSYFKEDCVARLYVLMREITDEKFKMPQSKPVKGFMSYFGATAGKKNIALIVINNSRLDIDPKVKIEMNYQKGYYELLTKKYGSFDIKEAKTRYKFGRQNIFVVMVDTSDRQPEQELEILPAPVTDQVLPTEQEKVQAMQPVLAAAARKRGRPKKDQTIVVDEAGTT